MKKEVFAKQLAELINRHGVEREYNDTLDYILANVAIGALEQFAQNSKVRDEWHGFRNADKDKCDCPAMSLLNAFEALNKEINEHKARKRRYKKPEVFDVPKGVQIMAEALGNMFPGAMVGIYRIEMLQRTPRNKRRGKNKRKGGRNNGTR